MAVDLGKQIGPLPLGAWLVAGAAGIGIAVWARSNNQPDEPMEDIGGTPGVGTGEVDGWTPTNPLAPGQTAPEPMTNDEWARAVINYLIAQGYPSEIADSAIRKYIAGETMSIQEWALLRIGLAKFGSPTTPLPPGQGPPTGPPGSPPPPSQAPPPHKAPPPVGTKISVPLGKDLYQWTADVSRSYNTPYSLTIMRALNPTVDFYIRWLGATSPKTPVFRPEGGVPPVRIR